MAVSRVFGSAALRLVAACGMFAAVAVAQGAAWPESGSHVYRGALATAKGQLAVQMSLVMPRERGKGVGGEYRYEGRGRGLELAGDAIGEHGELMLREYLRADEGGRGAESGRFDGKLDAGARHFTGTWHSADGRSSLRFAFELVAVARVTSSQQPFGPSRELHGLVMVGSDPLAQAVNVHMQQQLLGYAAAAATVDEQPTWQEFRDVQDGTASNTPAALHSEEGWARWAAYHIGDELVSLGEQVWEYSGGAHGNYGFAGLNLVLRDGKAVPLHLVELAVDERSGPKLCSMVREKLRDLGASGAGGVEDRALDEQSFDCFLISPAGIVLGFAPYEVGSYAEGPFFVQLTWSELHGVLSPPAQLRLAPTKQASEASESSKAGGRGGAAGRGGR